jgi:uroporphyrinogen decarboxylase
MLCCTTIFNAWTQLRRCLGDPHAAPIIGAGSDDREEAMKGWLAQDRPAFVDALDKIARSLANFAARCVEAGADGVFLSCREDWVEGLPGAAGPVGTPGAYAEVVRERDLLILDAVKDAPFNVLHVCGRRIHLERFNDYPVQVVNWPDREYGPSIADAKGWVKPALCGGVNNLTTLPHGTPAQCAEEVRDALRQAGDRPLIVGAGCTYDPDAVPAENLHAIRRAVEG